jgi:hypothetical protein
MSASAIKKILLPWEWLLDTHKRYHSPIDLNIFPAFSTGELSGALSLSEPANSSDLPMTEGLRWRPDKKEKALQIGPSKLEASVIVEIERSNLPSRVCDKFTSMR